MSDYLINYGNNPLAKKITKNMGISIPTPLQRDQAPWDNDFFADGQVVVGGNGMAHPQLSKALLMNSCKVYLDGNPELSQIYSQNQVEDLPEVTARFEPQALIFDGTLLKKVDELQQLYKFFHPRLSSLSQNGRVLVITPIHSKSPEEAAVYKAIEGFTRSLARELGKKGSTAQLVRLTGLKEEAAKELPSVVQFLLSKRSAFISGQVINVSKSFGKEASLNGSNYLKGKVALITGAARGIGAATAKALHLEGAHIIGIDRPEDDRLLGKVMEECQGTSLLLDISDKSAGETVTKFIASQFGKIHIAVHNAGITRDKTLARMKKEWWDATIHINLRQVLNITEKIQENHFANEGRIICLSSISGIGGNYGQTNYSATKAAIIGYVEAMAQKLANRGITVNAIAPGHIQTRMTDSIPFITKEFARRLSNVSQGGLPMDIAQAIAFLASPGAAGINGQTIRVCGGHLLGS